MMRCGRFLYESPSSLKEACARMEDAGGEAMILAGGTDLVPNMKRRQQTPRRILSLRRVAELKESEMREGKMGIGAMTTLASLTEDAGMRKNYAALVKAAAQVATPHLRNMGTLGGNLCLDTRCNYYDQNYEWRKAISFCMKKDGEICWVAPGSKRCWAVSSTDTAPALASLGAEVVVQSTQGERALPLAELYRDDGIDYLGKKATEIVTRILLPVPAAGESSTYWKLRRRGSFDFPVLSVALWMRRDAGGVVQRARLVLGSVASRPVLVNAASNLVGSSLTDDSIRRLGEEAAALAKPLDNTDFSLGWRKKAARYLVEGALRELRGEDPASLGPFARRASELVPA
jgi:4-hydroxybenzoyl-CoA reductase subunit beta